MNKLVGLLVLLTVFILSSCANLGDGEFNPKFSDTFYEAIEKGVEIYPVQFELVERDIIYKGLLPIGPKGNY